MSSHAPQGFPTTAIVLATTQGLALVPTLDHPILFSDCEVLGTNISFDAGTFTLCAGHTYKCMAGITTGIFSGPRGSITCQWRNITGSVLFGVNCIQSASGGRSRQSGLAVGLITTTSNTTIQLETTVLRAVSNIGNIWATVEVVA